MDEIEISEFKAKCLRLVEQVARTQTPIRITRRGKVTAEVVPAASKASGKFFGRMAGMGKALGDVIEPVIDLNNFDAAK
jgi:prevent-host-death family protein